MEKFTFKKEPMETGPASVGHQNTLIKFDKKPVGTITVPSWQTKDVLWVVRLTVKSLEYPCGWKWVTLKQRFGSEPEARQHVMENADKILALNLHQMEDE